MKIRVRVFQRSGRRCFEAQWSDPLTGKKKTRNTYQTTRKEAIRFAAKLEAEIEEGRFRGPVRTTWAEFRQRYDAEVLKSQRPASRAKMISTLNAIERHISPRLLAGVDAAEVSRFQHLLRSKDLLAEATIKSHLVCLRAGLRWAAKMGMIEAAPQFEMPKRVRGMKGRPITAEEFDRIIVALRAQLEPDLSESWEWLARGLWASGLRLGEALNLHWTDDRQLRVDLTGRRAMFRIRAGAEKGKRDRVLPMAPEFAELLETIPPERRRGYVFRPKGPEGLERLSMNWVSKMLVRFGEKAGVKVSERETLDDKGDPLTSVKWASAHDYRRAFGFRWAMRVMPPVLMEMMRHESINTTMEFYVGRNAEATADAMWAAYQSSGQPRANKTANKTKKPAPANTQKPTE